MTVRWRPLLFIVVVLVLLYCSRSHQYSWLSYSRATPTQQTDELHPHESAVDFSSSSSTTVTYSNRPLQSLGHTSARLDRFLYTKCLATTPAAGDGRCLLLVGSGGKQQQRCILSFHRVTERSCGTVAQRRDQHITIDTDMMATNSNAQRRHRGGQRGGRALCHCEWKHAALVTNVVVVATLSSRNGRVEKIAAFSQVPTASVIRSHSAPELFATGGEWGVVDAASCIYSSMQCTSGPVAEVIYTAEVKELYRQLLDRIAIFREASNVTERIDDTRQAPLGDVKPAIATLGQRVLPSDSCDLLRKHNKAVKPNRTYSLHDGTQTEHTEVFYAMDSLMSAPGHALELLINGLGVYFRDNLHQRSVPWLIPCRESNSTFVSDFVSPIHFTRFFLELNDELELPFFPVSLDELHVTGAVRTGAATLSSNRTMPQVSDRQQQQTIIGSFFLMPIRFSKIFFAPYFFQGWNQFCFKQMMWERLWPKAMLKRHTSPRTPPRTTAHSDSRQAARMDVPPPLHPLSSPQVAKEEEEASVPPRNIALIKTSGWRAFSRSPSFDRLLVSHNVTRLSTTLPLLQRMWLLNHADLLVTTWGSTLTTSTGLMLPRSWLLARTKSSRIMNTTRNKNASSESQQQHAVTVPPPTQRMLVLVNSQYCHEAHKLFRVAKKDLCAAGQQRMSRKLLRTMSFNHGALTDFSDSMFCVKFVFVWSLDSVKSADLTFGCGVPGGAR